MGEVTTVELRSIPKTTEDLFVSSGCNWLVSYENLSNLNGGMQDALCILATGGGHASRTLYTNSEETVIKTKRPVILNGISHVITAQDLTDRSIQVELQPIQYIEEAIINEEWTRDVPIIFGGVLDLFAKTLAKLPEVNLNNPPRMADFTRLGEAMCLAMGHSTGFFTKAYTANRHESIGKALEASPAAVALRDMVSDHKGSSNTVFIGTMQKLLEALELYKHEHDAWPKSARGLGDVLRRQQPALTTLGISIEISKPKRDGVTVHVKKCEHGEHREGHFNSNVAGENFSIDTEVF